MKLVIAGDATAFNPEQVVMVSPHPEGTRVSLVGNITLNVSGVEPLHLIASINEALK